MQVDLYAKFSKQIRIMKKIGILLSFIIVVSGCLSLKGQSDKSQKYFAKGLQAHAQGDYAASMEFAERAINADKTNADAYGLAGLLYDYKQDWKNSAAQYKNALLYSDKAKYYYFLGDLYYRYGEYTDAKNYLTQLFEHKDLNTLKSTTVSKAQNMLEKATFAETLKANPIPFNPINMGPNINTSDHEYFPGVSIDKKYFFFTRRNYVQEKFYGSEIEQEDIYRSTLDTSTNTWNVAQGLGDVINSSANEGTVSPTIDGKYIFFTECNRAGNVGKCDIYFSKITNGVWSSPLLIKPPLNSREWESQPCISGDGKTLYFASERQPSYGGIDLFKSEFVDGAFQQPVNLGPKINTKGNEQSPFIHIDGKTLYFTSDEHPGLGNNDIFMSRLEDDSWSAAQNLGYPINSYKNEQGIVVDRLGGMAYYTSDKDGGYGGLDLYTFDLPDAYKPIPSSYVEGLVTDIVTREKLASNVELIDLKTGKFVASLTTEKGEGDFLIALPGRRDYLLNVNNQAYLFYSNNFSLQDNTSTKPYFLDIRLSRPNVGEKVVLKNIFFDIDKYDIKQQSKIELDKLVALLKRFENLKIEIGGHTDNTGSAESNLILSKNRAKAVMDYLVDYGIDKTRLTYAGYGATKPIATNETDEGKAENRRTEFKVISN